MIKMINNMLTITHSTRKMLIFDPEEQEYYDQDAGVIFNAPTQEPEDSYILLEDKQTKLELRLPDMEPVLDAVEKVLEPIFRPLERAWTSVFSSVASLAMPRMI